MIQITKEEISIGEVFSKFNGPENGASVFFVGTVREASEDRTVRSMELEAYPEMAEKEMAELRSRALEGYRINQVVIIHRYGHLVPGDVIVLIIVFAPHRRDAFDACRFLIDHLKRTVPIWKKETYDDGSVWVEGDKE